MPFALARGLAQHMCLSALAQGKEVSPGTQDPKSSSSLSQRADTARLAGCSVFTRGAQGKLAALSPALLQAPASTGISE